MVMTEGSPGLLPLWITTTSSLSTPIQATGKCQNPTAGSEEGWGVAFEGPVCGGCGLVVVKARRFYFN
jgi:hypothetical protein